MSDHLPRRNEESTAAIMLTIADTTWRMVTPPIIFVPAGLYADIHWHTKPWLTLLSAAIGLGIGVILIRQQLKRIG